MSRDLLERSDELSRTGELLELARAGHGGLLLISGPAGIGKTALCDAAVLEARRAGMRVLTARGGELETGFSFGVARQLFEPVLVGVGDEQREPLLTGAARRALIALEGEPLEPGEPRDRSFAVIHGLYWLAVNLSATGPALIAIDDLHWADTASMRWVLYLSDRLEGLQIALVLCTRAGEAGESGELGARLEQIAAGRLVQPAPLSRPGVEELLRTALQEPPDKELVDASHAVTGGNPFLLAELAGALRADRIDSESGTTDRVLELGPRSVARSVSLRVARVGPQAGELARAAAILGDGAQLRHVAALAGMELEQAAPIADRLAAIGLLSPETPLRFVHAIVRSAVYEDIPVAERALRHAAAARLLAAGGADPDQVCAHLLRCEPAGSAEVVDQLRGAATRALARGAPESAATYLRRALTETVDAELRPTLLLELGLAEKLMRTPEAADHLREALELAGDPRQRAEIAAVLADLLGMAGQWDSALEIVEPVLEQSRSGGSSTSTTFDRAESVWSWLASYDTRRVERFDRRADELLAALDRGAIDQPPHALTALLAVALAWRGRDLARARELLAPVLGDDRLLDSLDTDPLPVLRAFNAAYALDDLERLAVLVEEVLAASRTRGSVFGLVLGLGYRVAIRSCRGELPGAESDLRAVFELAQQHALAFALPSVLWLGVDALIERPELADIAALAAAIELAPDLARTGIGAILREVRGRLAFAQGDRVVAQTAHQEAASRFEALAFLNPNATCWRSALALVLDDRDAALALAGAELEDARRMGFPRPQGIALRTLGVLEGGERGVEHLREAAAVLEPSYARLEYARALVELGAALRRRNQRAAAREPLREALDLAHRCGAVRLADRARVELLSTGARPRRIPTSGAESLTAAERRVAELAAQGMSNPEIAQALFVTINTVEGHMRHIFQKLSIGSRRELGGVLDAGAHGASPSTEHQERQKTTVPP